METRYLDIAGLTYKVSPLVKLKGNYQPFMVETPCNTLVASTISVGDISVTDKKDCHQGLDIDPDKDLAIYHVKDGAYYASVRVHGVGECYELYASPKWDEVIFSKNCISDNCPASVIDIFMMLTFIYSSAYYQTVLIHSSCIKCGEQAVAFIGQSGAGKSTHSRLWLTYIPNTMLLNDDQPAVRVYEDGTITIYGTPWSGKTLCYKHDSAELKGIVRMVQAPFNKITALDGINLFRELLSSSSMIREDENSFKLIVSTLAKISSHISGFILENKPEEAAALLAYTNTIK